jgi:hypothetical protein
MRLQTYVMIIFAICLSGWFMGYDSGLTTLWEESNGNISLEFILARIGESILSQPLLTGLLGVALAVAGALAIYTGFSAMFVIPMLILLGVSNLLFFPLNFFLDSSCVAIDSSAICQPDPLTFPIFLFLNILTILTCVEFIRGQS